MGYVGSRMRRLEDPRLLAGVGHFADDEKRPGQLWMRVVRSPVAHAVLGAVDVGDALKLSGVRTALTSADISLPPIPVRVSPDPGDLSAYLQPVLARAMSAAHAARRRGDSQSLLAGRNCGWIPGCPGPGGAADYGWATFW